MLLWYDNTSVSVKSFTKFHIDAIITVGESPSWRFTDFYEDPIPANRVNS